MQLRELEKARNDLREGKELLGVAVSSHWMARSALIFLARDFGAMSLCVGVNMETFEHCK